MPKKTLILLVVLAAMAGFLGWNYYFQPFLSQVADLAAGEVVPEASPAAELSSVDAVFGKMTEKDKVGQVMAWPVEVDQAGMIKTEGMTEAEFLTNLNKTRPGTITLFGDQISTTSARRVIDEIKAHHAGVLLSWIAVDHEGGRVQRLNGDGFTKISSWNSFCAADRTPAQQALGKSARELKAVGVNVVLAPVVDVGAPRGFMGDRLCSTKPTTVVENVQAFISIFKEQSILPVVKHFPGIGKVSTDLHQKFAVTRVGVEDVFVYRSILDQDQEVGVMTAHVGLENQYADVPCSMSAACVSELTENYPQALVFTDALEMKSAHYLPAASRSAQKSELTLGEVSLRAILAGNNVLVYGASSTSEQLLEVYGMLVREYSLNTEFKDKIDQSVKKIIAYKLGLAAHDTQTGPASSN